MTTSQVNKWKENESQMVLVEPQDYDSLKIWPIGFQLLTHQINNSKKSKQLDNNRVVKKNND
jgi:hypothetical protein